MDVAFYRTVTCLAHHITITNPEHPAHDETSSGPPPFSPEPPPPRSSLQYINRIPIHSSALPVIVTDPFDPGGRGEKRHRSDGPPRALCGTAPRRVASVPRRRLGTRTQRKKTSDRIYSSRRHLTRKGQKLCTAFPSFISPHVRRSTQLDRVFWG